MVACITITTNGASLAEWKSMWGRLLDKHRHELDMSSVDLDGSHTATLRGGEESDTMVGRDGRRPTHST